MIEQGIDSLVELGFTRLEATIYIFLLQASPATGYRIAQAIGKPAANTYKAIQALEIKGAILVEEDRNRLCRAVPLPELLAQIERRFKRQKENATTLLSVIDHQEDDDRVYQIRSREQVLERFRQMLQRSRQIVVIDISPQLLDELRDDITQTARRGVDVAIKVYQPAEIPGASIFEFSAGDAIIERWPGLWMNIVIDGMEHLMAFFSRDGNTVHQAVWSGSAYLSWIYYSAVKYELVMADVKKRLMAGTQPQELLQQINRYEQFFPDNAPGYEKLIRRFGDKPEE